MDFAFTPTGRRMLTWRCGRSLFTGSGIRRKRRRVAVRRPKRTTAMHKWAVVRQHVSGKHLVQLLAFEAASSEFALSSALGQLVASMAGTYAWQWPLPAIRTPKPATDRDDRSPQRAQWWTHLRSAARRVGAASAAAYAHW